MVRVIVVGGGYSGCGAAISAAKAGAKVTLLERTDRLLGVAGLGSGHTNHNGKFVIAEEAKAMGANEMYDALESIKIHQGYSSNYPGGIHEFAYIFHVGLSDPTVKKLVQTFDIDIRFKTRVVDVKKTVGDVVSAMVLADDDIVEGNAFVDATGSHGGLENCVKYGRGCVLCYQNCLVYGNRVSPATKAGAPEFSRRRPDGTPGVVESALLLYKETLTPELCARIEKQGVVTVPLPSDLIDYEKLKIKSASSHDDKGNVENIVLVDIGHVAKTSGLVYMPLQDLRRVPGFENVVIAHPLAGGVYNAIAGMSYTLRDDSMRVDGFKNLFCAGEKSGATGGLAEAIITGYLAGHNAARVGVGKPLLILPRETVVGDYVAFVNEKSRNENPIRESYGPGGGIYFKRIRERGLYTLDVNIIKERVRSLGLEDVFRQRVVS